MRKETLSPGIDNIQLLSTDVFEPQKTKDSIYLMKEMFSSFKPEPTVSSSKTWKDGGIKTTLYTKKRVLPVRKQTDIQSGSPKWSYVLTQDFSIRLNFSYIVLRKAFVWCSLSWIRYNLFKLIAATSTTHTMSLLSTCTVLKVDEKNLQMRRSPYSQGTARSWH